MLWVLMSGGGDEKFKKVNWGSRGAGWDFNDKVMRGESRYGGGTRVKCGVDLCCGMANS